MLTRILAAAAFAMLSAAAAQAGTLQNGTYTTSCPVPGDAPAFSSKSAEAYNASAKPVQAWQESVKAYQTCLGNEVKADQTAMIAATNDRMKTLGDQINAANAASAEVVEKLKKKQATTQH